MFNATRNVAAKFGARIMVGSGLAFATMLASAQTSGAPYDAILDAVTLDGMLTKIGAGLLVVISIALALKGTDVGKRLIRKA